MMLTPHILAGAALATIMPTSAAGKAAAFVVGVLSHFALDALPHWERLLSPHYNDELSRNHHLWPKHIYIQAVLDILVGAGLLSYFVIQAPAPHAPDILLGGIGAAFPDIMDNVPWWKQATRKLPVWGAIAKLLHDRVHMTYIVQRKIPHSLGLITQVITVALTVIVLINFI